MTPPACYSLSADRLPAQFPIAKLCSRLKGDKPFTLISKQAQRPQKIGKPLYHPSIRSTQVYSKQFTGVNGIA